MKLPHGALEEVVEGVFVAMPNPGEGTMGVVVTSGVKIAIDTSSYDGFARMVKQAIDLQFPGPWRFVITTHSHFDHVGGNQVFATPIIASTLTAERMRAFTPEWLHENTQRWLQDGVLDGRLLESPHIVMPELLFDKKLTVRLADLSLQITRLGGHSEDSSVVYIPERKVLFAADLIFNDKPAATAEADLAQWQRSLRRLQKLPVEFVIAGHGPPGGPELLAAQLDEIDALIAKEVMPDES